MHILRKKQVIIPFLLILLVSSIYASSSTSSLNWLSRNFADTLYCPIDGSCVNSSASTIWNRSGTTIIPAINGDDIDTSGDLYAANIILSNGINVNGGA